jgi:hypothetical protein
LDHWHDCGSEHDRHSTGSPQGGTTFKSTGSGSYWEFILRPPVSYHRAAARGAQSPRFPDSGPAPIYPGNGARPLLRLGTDLPGRGGGAREVGDSDPGHGTRDPHPHPHPHPRFAGDRGWGSRPRFAGDRGSPIGAPGIGGPPPTRIPGKSGVPCPARTLRVRVPAVPPLTHWQAGSLSESGVLGPAGPAALIRPQAA